ncbi:MAG: single-stranded-DNA-specific exonuclease RecJ [Gammaproteobacteria bacterium]|nr:single-stranded-DNA-specific exonuclease RecJ [Gammaproteobacteria bacterium]
MEVERRSVGEVAPELAARYPRFFADALAARGIDSADALDLSLSGLLSPRSLRGVDVAAERLARAVTGGEPVLVVGDFDADGATGTALAVSVLRAFGAESVDFLVPNRFDFGYGLSPELARVALAREPAVVMTVDNGIASVEGVRVLQAAGVDVVVTDHHLAGAELPPAYAIVNPNAPGCRFPSKALAGVGVVYYVLSQVRAQLEAAGHFNAAAPPRPNLAAWLDLVALGTVADVVPLDRNNRILVHHGLRRIRAGRARPGIAALAEAAKRSTRRMRAADLGFAIGPRLNAAGRLDDMSAGIECLLADDLRAARPLAARLDTLNLERRDIEQAMTAEAAVLIDEAGADGESAVCVYEPGWHQGVIGIVAGRVRERLHRPTIAFADAGEMAPDELRGSARSIPNLHIRDAIADVAARFPGLVVRFGGHAMAAGLTIKRVQLARFSKAFREAVDARVSARDLRDVRATDGDLPGTELTLENALLVADHGPWGAGFEEPTFHGEFEVVHERVVGERHLKLVLKRGERVADAIAFDQEPLGARRVRALYQLGINDYRDMETLQLRVADIEPVPTASAE